MEDFNAIQSELDAAEEYILTKIFGSLDNIRLTGASNWIFTQVTKGKNFQSFLNEYIQIFEKLAKGFITENGYVDGNSLTELVTAKAPILRGALNLPTLKPIDYAKMLDKIINFEALGQIIKML